MELEQSIASACKSIASVGGIIYPNIREAWSHQAQKEGLLPTPPKHQGDMEVCLLSLSSYLSRDPYSSF